MIFQELCGLSVDGILGLNILMVFDLLIYQGLLLMIDVQEFIVNLFIFMVEDDFVLVLKFEFLDDVVKSKKLFLDKVVFEVGLGDYSFKVDGKGNVFYVYKLFGIKKRVLIWWGVYGVVEVGGKCWVVMFVKFVVFLSGVGFIKIIDLG